MFKILTRTIVGILIIAITPLTIFIVQKNVLEEKHESLDPQHILVLGASVVQNKEPSTALKNRLDSAIRIYTKDTTKKIIVSGDGRQENYNEPGVMKEYLIKNNVVEQNIIIDTEGYRTINSCLNVKEQFEITEVYITTQGFHLPRSLFLCESMGIKSKPIRAYNSSEQMAIYGYTREIGASWLALFESIKY